MSSQIIMLKLYYRYIYLRFMTNVIQVKVYLWVQKIIVGCVKHRVKNIYKKHGQPLGSIFIGIPPHLL